MIPLFHDLAGADVVVAATDDAAVNEAVVDAAGAAGALANSADGGGDVAVPATAGGDRVTVAVGTDGASPAVSRRPVREPWDRHPNLFVLGRASFDKP